MLCRRPAAAVVAGFLLVLYSASAQVAVESPTSTEPEAPVVTPGEAEALRSEPIPMTPDGTPLPASAAGAEIVPSGRPVAEIPRRFKYTLSATLRGIYDDNVYNRSSNATSDYSFAIEPAIFIGLGDSDGVNSVSLTYHPSIFIFVNNSRNDNVQHVIQLQAGRRFGHLALSFSQDVQILDGTDLNSLSDPTGHQANIDVSGRNRHQTYTSTFGGSYDLTGKLFLSSGGFFVANEYPSTLISSQSSSGNLFLNYTYSEKLTVGLGGTGGYSTTSNTGSISNDETFEQANARFDYNATAKISLSASVGIEFRQNSNSTGSEVSPVYNLSASYQPFDGTSLSLNGSRTTRNSASQAGQDYSDTTINFSLNQRLLQRFFVGFAVGYTNNSYFSTINGITANRDDNFYYISPSVDFNVTRFWTFGVYYQHRENSSSDGFSSFQDNQAGIRTKLTF
jgi:hypothetical protein